MPIKPLEIEEIESKAGNIYEAIVISAKRARQINDEVKIEFNQKIQPIMEKEEDDESIVSKDKMNISMDFEKRKKPTDTALNELLTDELTFRARTED